MAELTLSEKSILSDTPSFRSRVLQGLFSKANFFKGQSNPANLKEQKQQDYARKFVNGGSSQIDIFSTTRLWLANYNTPTPLLDEQIPAQPTDSEILNTAALDIVFDSLAGVLPGDINEPIVE